MPDSFWDDWNWIVSIEYTCWQRYGIEWRETLSANFQRLWKQFFSSLIKLAAHNYCVRSNFMNELRSIYYIQARSQSKSSEGAPSFRRRDYFSTFCSNDDFSKYMYTNIKYMYTIYSTTCFTISLGTTKFSIDFSGLLAMESAYFTLTAAWLGKKKLLAQIRPNWTEVQTI